MSNRRVSLSVNYSHAARELVENQLVSIDCFKTPAWPDLVAEAQKILPVNVHFPLAVGYGIGDAINTETKKPADWLMVEDLQKKTNTRFINVHLAPPLEDGIALSDAEGLRICSDRLVERALKDLAPLIARFGKAQIIVENIFVEPGLSPDHCALAEVISRVVELSGAGFLLDISHAQLAARFYGKKLDEYLAELPRKRIKEFHVTGVHYFGDDWIAKLREKGIPESLIARYANRHIDHLPLTEYDWEVLQQAISCMYSEEWSCPWLASFEYGGVGSTWEALLQKDVLETQLVRMAEMFADR